MADVFTDGFDIYEGDADRMLEGIWAETDIDVFLATPSAGARTGTTCLRIGGGVSTNPTRVRAVLPAPLTEIIFAFPIHFEQLPASNNRNGLGFRTSGNNDLMALMFQADGSIDLYNGSTSSQEPGSFITGTNGPVIQAGTWHFIELKLTVDDTTGALEVRVDNMNSPPAINASGIDTGTTAIGQFRFENSGSREMFIDDLVVRDTTGSLNNDLQGDHQLATIPLVADASAQGWTARPRHKIAEGVLNIRSATDDEGVSCAPSADFTIGTGDFTYESFVRFGSIPTGSQKAQIAGVWDENSDERSWQLFKSGPDQFSGRLVYRVSSDGTVGTVTNLLEVVWEPVVDRWYHVAVSRDTGITRVFIDGIQVGADIADTVDYFVANAPLAMGVEMSSLTDPIDNTGIDGFLDEIRFTVGFSRYAADFTPTTTKFGRDVMTDPNFANVVLLAGFDQGLDDESSFDRTITARGGAEQLTVDDADGAYQTISLDEVRDGTYIEAALVPAEATFTASNNMQDGETITLGAITYTLVNLLGLPNTILIGVDLETTLLNITAAVNLDPGAGTIFAVGTIQNPLVRAVFIGAGQIRFIARSPGSSGNSITTTETTQDGEFDNATMQGGQDIPGPSEFFIGALPPETTGIRSLSIFYRGSKSDAGPSEVTASFVTAADDVEDGTNRAMTTNVRYHRDIIEQDPTTMGALTPSSFLGAKIRFDRTL